MMGGSYGGYMANWMAGHTDRFRAIVSHAGLWHLDQMFGTTDHPMFWRRQFGDPLRDPAMYQANSPHQHVGQISTPMLVIHGDKDYRVPVGEALRLWCGPDQPRQEAKFLYFPDENHWILTPGNAPDLVRDGVRVPGPARARASSGSGRGSSDFRVRGSSPRGPAELPYARVADGPSRPGQETGRGGGDVRRHRRAATTC